MKKILLLGSGELGKEFTISAKRLGCYVTACDSYNGAPAMQVADHFEVFDMLDGELLSQIIDQHQPDLIVPEVEAIRTEVLLQKEEQGHIVVPTARATNLTMNRDRIRDRAVELGLRTPKFCYAESMDELHTLANDIGFPLVLKPVMSSSGKGQKVVNSAEDLESAWFYAIENMRGDRKRVILEEFVQFEFEITLLTVKQHEGETLFCTPIGHYQERGDYQNSWQDQPMSDALLERAKHMARVVTDDLGGAGIFGVEFFVTKDEVIFSELSPRPHDTGMVTMYTQNLSEFDLHARAILGLPIPEIRLIREGASHVILATGSGDRFGFIGIDEALKFSDVDVRIFGKPTTRPHRRMGVVLGPNVETAAAAAKKIKVV